MSFFVSGYLLLKSEIVHQEKIRLAFCFHRYAIDNALGLKLDSNIDDHLLKRYTGGFLKKIPFCIADNPLTNVAQVLFSRNNMKLYENYERVDTGEPLSYRMKRVEHFLYAMLSHTEIENILLNVNLEFDQEKQPLSVSVADFSGYMIKQICSPKWSEEERLIIYR